jgi:DNA-binding MarR family transcriptional regulator
MGGGAAMDDIDSSVRHLHEVVERYRLSIVERLGLFSKGEVLVLHSLAERESVVIPTELSAALGSSTPRIAAVLGSLEKKGQVTRDIDKSDRRRILVAITELGRERVIREDDAMQSCLKRIFREMGENDTGEFIRTLERFLEIASKLETVHGCFTETPNNRAE